MIVKVCDYFLSKGEPRVLLCPQCKSRALEVITARHDNGKTCIVKLVCRSTKCKKRVVYDVTGGFPSR